MLIRSSLLSGASCRLTWILVVYVLAACAAEGPDGDGDAGGADAGRWTLHEVFRIGSVDAPGTSFTHVTGIARVGDTILVIERDPPRAARFTLDGRWLGDFAREGDGPGELRFPDGIGVTAGRIWTFDVLGRRLEVYASTGRHVESFRFQIPGDFSGVTALPAALLSDGSILAVPVSAAPMAALMSGAVRHWTYRGATRAGEDRGPLYAAEVYPTDFFDGRYISGWHPLPEMALVEPFPDGSGVVAIERRWTGQRPAVFRVLVHGPQGRIETDALLPFDPIPADDFLEPFLVQREAEFRANPRIATERIPAMLEDFRAVSPRAHYPPVTDLVPGMDGSIWIRREDTFADSVAWQVLDREARLLATLTTHADLTLHLTSRGEVWGVETDELGVEYVVGFEVRR